MVPLPQIKDSPEIDITLTFSDIEYICFDCDDAYEPFDIYRTDYTVEYLN